MERVYHKLVRDRIPEIISSSGEKPIIRRMETEEYKRSLFRKLAEEMEEFQADESIEELCDVLEVLEALAEVFGYSPAEISEMKEKKRITNGAFRDRIFLEKVVEKSDGCAGSRGCSCSSEK